MTRLEDLEAAMRANGIIACNIQFNNGEFQAHIRRNLDEGFICAQKRHPSIVSAIGEHFAYSPVVSVVDLTELLV
jgi:hypothetical protein